MHTSKQISAHPFDAKRSTDLRKQSTENIVKNIANYQRSQHVGKKINSLQEIFILDFCIQRARQDQT